MKKQFKLDEIDCANCARELQDELAKLDGVKSVSVNFMTQKLTLEADDAEFDEVLDRVVEFTADAEPDCRDHSLAQVLRQPARPRLPRPLLAKLYERVFIHSNGRIRVMGHRRPQEEKEEAQEKRVTQA